MNIVIVSGKVADEPEQRTLASGAAMVTLTIVNTEQGFDGKERTQYIKCVAWGRVAEQTERINKGDYVVATGRWSARKVDERYFTEVNLSTVEVLDTHEDEGLFT